MLRLYNLYSNLKTVLNKSGQTPTDQCGLLPVQRQQPDQRAQRVTGLSKFLPAVDAGQTAAQVTRLTTSKAGISGPRAPLPAYPAPATGRNWPPLLWRVGFCGIYASHFTQVTFSNVCRW